MIKKVSKSLLSLLMAVCLVVSLVATAIPTMAADAVIISNPYASVNWSSYGQYKADFHAHSTNSDGGNLMKDMVEDHYAKGYDILAMTDHNYLTPSWNQGANGVTPEREADITAGVDRGGRGMIDIFKSDEQSITDHINSFFADFNNASGATIAGTIQSVQDLGGITHINHPGRYTGGSAGGAAGVAASNSPATVQKYVDLFTAYPSCVGMEIVNKIDNESRSDRILWDNILEEMMPTGRNVWGFSNDDTHSINATGYSWNVMLMPSLSQDSTRTAMETGAFYAVSRVSRPDGINATLPGGGSMPGSGNSNTLYLLGQTTPSISNIVVDEAENTITLAGQDYDVVEWIADGMTIATGNTIDIDNYAGQINSYVRAQLKSSTGIAFTQPFGVTGLENSGNQEQPAPTGLVGMAPSTGTNNDGRINNTTAAMEYKLSSGSTWTMCPGSAITGLTSGSYEVRLAAKTGFNASPATTLTVPAYVPVVPAAVTLIEKNAASWKYNDSNTNMQTAWRAAAYDDSAWKTGDSPLGYPATDSNPTFGAISTGTTVANASKPNAYITYYFRKTFDVAADALTGITKLDLTMGIDDGYVLYINGTEVRRDYLPSGVDITWQTWATLINEPSDPTGTVTADITAAALPLLTAGTNTIAVEVHNRDNNSSDIYFDMQLIATTSQTNQDQNAPSGLVAIAPTSSATNDGRINNTAGEMEYKLSTASTWTACPGSAITGLASGSYEVRLAAKTGFNASPAATVIVPAYSAVAYAATSITFQPGSDESSMNFTWYSASAATAGAIQVALKSAMTGTDFPVDSAASFTATISASGDAKSNEASVTGLLPNTEYVYRLGDGTNFSSVYSFNTDDLTDGYNAILVGDPQIGSGGTLNGMTGWQNTITQALTDFPETSFILSAGDQVNTATSEAEYTGFFSPAELTSMPLVPTIGNHDNAALYQKHYNSPNESTAYGTTSAGGDYWFRYGNTLYMVLNTNTQSVTTHDAFIREAINAAGSGIQWKVVMFHHAVYSSAGHSTEDGIKAFRAGLYPVMDKYDIDVVFAGHDHCYTRTYQMEGGIAQNGLASTAVNPVGTLYITANSGSGSKYYDFEGNDTAYAAVHWQERVPTYSNVSVTDNSFTVTTYRTDTGAQIDTYTITKDLTSAPTGLAGVEPTTEANNDGKITGTTAAMEYKLTTQTTWTACTGAETTGLFPGVYDVRFAGTMPSVSVIVTVLPHSGAYQNQTAPATLASMDPTTEDNNDGQITGTTTAMEYRASGASAWTACSGTTITGLTPGTYEVRFKSKPGFNPGASAYMTLNAFASGGGNSITAKISTGNDDVEETASDGSMYMDSSDLEFMNDGSTNQIIGLRFTNMGIPVGATITSAYIQFSVDETVNADPFNVMIAAEKTADSPVFTASANNVSDRTPTTALAYWSGIPQWTTIHASVRTPDLTALVQEVVDLDGWAEGNAISFGFMGEGIRVAESFEGAGSSNPDQIPTLFITYEILPPTGQLEIPIGSALDDMEERADGTVDWDSSDLEITQENTNQQIGLRFDNLKIPQGAFITEAYIQFSVDETKTIDPFNVKIYTEAAADSASFQNQNFAVSTRTKSAAYVTWKDITPWTVIHEAGELEATPDLSSLVEAIVKNNDWTPGNAISFILQGQGQRCAESFEGAGANTNQIPTLHLKYTMIDPAITSARDALVEKMESGKYTKASVAAAQLVVDAVITAIADGTSTAKKAELLAALQSVSDALTLINQAKLEVAPNVVLDAANRTITFRLTVDQLQNVDVMEGLVKISDSRFEITGITSLYSGSNFIFTKNLNYSGDGTTAYFSLAKVGGFDDTTKLDVVDITIRLKDSMTAESLTAALSSITMYIGNSQTHTVTEVYSGITGDGTAKANIWFPSAILGDLNGKDGVTGMDLSLAMTFFGAKNTDADWYSSGAWHVDFNKDGVIDIGDLTAEACLAARIPLIV